MKPTLGRVVIFTDRNGMKCAALVVGVEVDGRLRGDVPRLVLAVFSPLTLSEHAGVSRELSESEVERGPAMLSYVRGVFEGVGPDTWAWPERAS